MRKKMQDGRREDVKAYGNGWSLVAEKDEHVPGTVIIHFPDGSFVFRPFPILDTNFEDETTEDGSVHHHYYYGPPYGPTHQFVTTLAFLRDLPAGEPQRNYLSIETTDGSTFSISGYPDALEQDLVALCDRVRTLTGA